MFRAVTTELNGKEVLLGFHFFWTDGSIFFNPGTKPRIPAPERLEARLQKKGNRLCLDTYCETTGVDERDFPEVIGFPL